MLKDKNSIRQTHNLLYVFDVYCFYLLIFNSRILDRAPPRCGCLRLLLSPTYTCTTAIWWCSGLFIQHCCTFRLSTSGIIR